VNVDTGAFQALTAEVARLAEAVRGMVLREAILDMSFDTGYAAGQEDIRKSVGMPTGGRAGKPGRAASCGHLRPLQEGGTS